MKDEFFTLSEVSAYLKIPKSTLYKLSQRREIPSVKIGKQLRFRKSSLDKWLTQQEGESMVLTSEPPLSLGLGNESELNIKQILVIDDDQLVLKTISKLIRAYGYGIELAASAEEALEKVKSRSFDLIIADVRMAGLDGIETIGKIREFYNHSRKTLPQEIIITGYMDTQAEERAGRLGIKDYVYKPFAVGDFIAIITKKIGFCSGLN